MFGGMLAKYLLKFNFWAFCFANLFNGLFAGSVPVGMAYACDVYTNRSEKDKESGNIVAINLLGNTGACRVWGQRRMGQWRDILTQKSP